MKWVLGNLLKQAAQLQGLSCLPTPHHLVNGLQRMRQSQSPQLWQQLAALQKAQASVGWQPQQVLSRLEALWLQQPMAWLGQGLLLGASKDDAAWLDPAWAPQPERRVARALAGVAWYLSQLPSPKAQPNPSSPKLHPPFAAGDRWIDGPRLERLEQARQLLERFLAAREEVVADQQLPEPQEWLRFSQSHQQETSSRQKAFEAAAWWADVSQQPIPTSSLGALLEWLAVAQGAVADLRREWQSHTDRLVALAHLQRDCTPQSLERWWVKLHPHQTTPSSNLRLALLSTLGNSVSEAIGFLLTLAKEGWAVQALTQPVLKRLSQPQQEALAFGQDWVLVQAVSAYPTAALQGGLRRLFVGLVADLAYAEAMLRLDWQALQQIRSQGAIYHDPERGIPLFALPTLA